MLPQQGRWLAHASRRLRESHGHPDELDFAGDGMLALDDHPTRLHLRVLDHLINSVDGPHRDALASRRASHSS